MKTLTTLVITLLSFVTTPVLAEDFYCPAPQPLPASLKLQPAPAPQPQLVQVQKYLNNLKLITKVYQTSNGFPMRQHEIATCLLMQVESLYFTSALQRPVTRADGATWFMLYDEVTDALHVINPQDLRRRTPITTINAWLNTRPQYAPTSPYAATPARTLASR